MKSKKGSQVRSQVAVAAVPSNAGTTPHYPIPLAVPFAATRLTLLSFVTSKFFISKDGYHAADGRARGGEAAQ